MQATLSSAYVSSILNILDQLGFQLSASQAQEITLDREQLTNLKYHVSLESVTALMNLAETALDAPDIGMQVGDRFRVHSFSETGSVLAYVKTIADAVAVNAQYQPLTETVGKCRLDRRKNGEFMVFETDVDHQIHRHVIEMIVAGYAVTTQWLGWSFEGGLHSAAFKHAAPSNTSRYQTVFRCPVTFGAKETAIRFHANIVDRPLPSHNPEKMKFLRAKLDKVLSKVKANATFRQNLSTAIAATLTKDKVAQDRVAAEMQLSPRSLSQKLKEADLSFRSELDAVRKTQCETLMKAQLSLTEVAHALGYSDQSAFTKAYKRWHGEAPSLYKARA